jgi:CRP-like cAMP-binding protein
VLQRTSDVQIGDQSPPLTANLLLKRLDAADRTLIERHAEALNARVGAVLFEAGQALEHVYFPVDTMVALENFGRVEVAIAGREGMAGWTALGGFNHSPYRAVVRWRDGWVLRVPIEPLLGALSTRVQLRWVLTQFAIVSAVQMAEGVGAHLHHRLDAAIVRWLLLRHDRVGGDWIRAHHQEIADNLGARRASVTDCLHIIEGEQHVRCRRGRILIRDRTALEMRAMGAYGTAESLYRASLGDFGKGANAN